MVKTRIAPSPTGIAHIGTAYMALFNYAFATKNGGEFLVRIEDTDRARSTKEAVDAIYKGLEWLGIDWDEIDIAQFRRGIIVSEEIIKVAEKQMQIEKEKFENSI